MRCTLDAVDTNGSVPADYLRVSSSRNPSTRALSGYAQVVELIQAGLNGRASAEIVACVTQKNRPGCNWGRLVGVPVGQVPVKNPFLAKLVSALVGSSFYTQHYPLSGSVAEYVGFLQLAARTYAIDCEAEWHAGEHAWPQWMHMSSLGRVDFVFRVESMADDQKRFLELLRQRGSRIDKSKCHTISGRCSPALCTIGRQGNSLLGKERREPSTAKAYDGSKMAIVNTDPKRIMSDVQSLNGGAVALQRIICAIYLPDMVCNGYKVPDHCTAGEGPTTYSWLEGTMRDLLRSPSNLFTASGMLQQPQRDMTTFVNDSTAPRSAAVAQRLIPESTSCPCGQGLHQMSCSCRPSIATSSNRAAQRLTAANGTIAHVSRPWLPLDRCIPGLLKAQGAAHQDALLTSLRPWLSAAIQTAPSCFKDAQRSSLNDPPRGATLVSHRYRFIYQSVQKAGANSLTHWMKCALGASTLKGPPPPHYLRATSSRNPWARSISAYGQVVHQVQVSLNGRAPAEIMACVRQDAPLNCSWGHVNGVPLGQLHARYPATARLVRQLASSQFYTNNHPLKGVASELRTFLQLASRTNSIGSEPLWFGSEHAWPQWVHMAPLGRVDFVFRVEHMETDKRQFLSRLGISDAASLPCTFNGKPCRREFCSIGNGASETSFDGRLLSEAPWLHKNKKDSRRTKSLDGSAHVFVETHLATLPSRVTDELQRIICVIYMPDYLCNGYPLPRQCRAADGTAHTFPGLMRQLVWAGTAVHVAAQDSRDAQNHRLNPTITAAAGTTSSRPMSHSTSVVGMIPLAAASIGIVTVDTRRTHPGISMWRAYATAHVSARSSLLCHCREALIRALTLCWICPTPTELYVHYDASRWYPSTGKKGPRVTRTVAAARLDGIQPSGGRPLEA